ncbi:MAG: transposase, partial [[Lactobacillus] timonensis]|nr:transposase [[Lactobacillus] timonensis]
LKANLEYVLNAAQFNFSNGPLEGLNRMIKQIERTAFGFRNFNYLVYRIYYRRMAKKNQTL